MEKKVIEPKEYYIVEFRLPIQINEANSIEDAAEKAVALFEREYNIRLSKWYTRVFRYITDKVGPEEYFCNPGGVKFRKLTQNHPEHGENNGEG